jgi:hypothetical protein
MKRIVNIVETTKDGLEKLLGEYVQLWCLNYIYAGKLVGVNEHDVVLAEAGVVYETGKLTDKTFKFFEPVGAPEHFVRIGMIESYSLAPQLVK